MLKQFVQIIILAILFSYCTDDFVEIPKNETCKLIATSNDQPTNDIKSYSYYSDSIICLWSYGSNNLKTKYTFNSTDEIQMETRYIDGDSLAELRTYYLDSQGMIDSFVRVNEEGLLITKYIVTRDASNRIISEKTFRFVFGDDNIYYYYDSIGNVAYHIRDQSGLFPIRDSIVYSHDMNLVNNGSPQFIFEDLLGTKSKHLVAGTKKYNGWISNNAPLLQEERYTYESFDSKGNVTSMKQEVSHANPPDSIFIPALTYNKTFEYNCSF